MQQTLTGELTILNAADVRTQLLEALAHGEPLELDTRQVTEVDAAGLQVLLAAFKSASNEKLAIHFPVDLRGPAVTSALELLGLTELERNVEVVSHDKEDTGR